MKTNGKELRRKTTSTIPDLPNNSRGREISSQWMCIMSTEEDSQLLSSSDIVKRLKRHWKVSINELKIPNNKNTKKRVKITQR